MRGSRTRRRGTTTLTSPGSLPRREALSGILPRTLPSDGDGQRERMVLLYPAALLRDHAGDAVEEAGAVVRRHRPVPGEAGQQVQVLAGRERPHPGERAERRLAEEVQVHLRRLQGRDAGQLPDVRPPRVAAVVVVLE